MKQCLHLSFHVLDGDERSLRLVPQGCRDNCLEMSFLCPHREPCETTRVAVGSAVKHGSSPCGWNGKSSSPILWVHVEKFRRKESFASVVEEFMMAFLLVFTVLERRV